MTITDISAAESHAVLQETRLRIIALLSSHEAHKNGGLTIQEIGTYLDCSPQNAHHHLRILAEAGAARISRTEATQRIPRQFWISDLRRIRIRVEGGAVELSMGLPKRMRARLERELRPWGEKNGGPSAVEAALGFGEFLASLGENESEELLQILRRNLVDE